MENKIVTNAELEEEIKAHKEITGYSPKYKERWLASQTAIVEAIEVAINLRRVIWEYNKNNANDEERAETAQTILAILEGIESDLKQKIIGQKEGGGK